MEDQIKFYEHKLAFEMDPSDLFDALNNGKKVIALDARKAFGFDNDKELCGLNLKNTAYLS